MISIELIRKNPNIVRASLLKRGENLTILEDIIKKDEEYRSVLKKLENLRHERNVASKAVAELKAKGEKFSKEVKKVNKINDEIKKLEGVTKSIKEEINEKLLWIPNIVHEDVPEEEDKVIKEWGEIPKFKFEPKGHYEILSKLGADFERASKVSGARFSYISDKLVILEMALARFAIDFMVKKGFKVFMTPHMVRSKAMYGTGHFPRGIEEAYKIEKEDLVLIGTSEVSLASYHSGEILQNLPLRYSGFTPCYRTEAGAHGRDTKGMFRTHQFHKIEQFIFCREEESWKEHELLRENVEEFYKVLGLPYRVVIVNSKDMGNAASKQYDLEVWFPSQNVYREVVSCSNTLDYQARRLNIKYMEKGKKKYVHTLNSTLVAIERTITAIAENYQTEDGHIKVPPTLVPYTGFGEI
ncbi:serine--tRNA ligase [Nanoarchaeota archaeon]|nr:MAG: serine--tRNA ligase [Nanoarchaeota archaeon]